MNSNDIFSQNEQLSTSKEKTTRTKYDLLCRGNGLLSRGNRTTTNLEGKTYSVRERLMKSSFKSSYTSDGVSRNQDISFIKLLIIDKYLTPGNSCNVFHQRITSFQDRFRPVGKINM